MINPYVKTTFQTSAHEVRQLPEDSGVEIAFAGRSNAGKSSAINTLTNQKQLAKTSKTPGRTQLINLFELDEQRRIVDLPGYGYAKVPAKVRAHWDKELEAYFMKRACLKGLVLLMDVRHPLTEFDQQMLFWCRESELPIHILLTKADKLKFGKAKSTLLSIQKNLKLNGFKASVQLFSSTNRTGLEALIEKLNDWYGIETTKPNPTD